MEHGTRVQVGRGGFESRRREPESPLFESTKRGTCRVTEPKRGGLLRPLELGGRPDLLPLLFAGVGVCRVPKPPVSELLHALIHRSAWNGSSRKSVCTILH